jgi:hypothetical protein
MKPAKKIATAKGSVKFKDLQAKKNPKGGALTSGSDTLKIGSDTLKSAFLK